jgi:uncharacterized membrane protein YhaH (DUF805 family)
MPTFQVSDFNRDDFPALHRSADDVSSRSQRLYLVWVAANLALLVVGALAAAIEGSPVSERCARWIAAIAFLAAIGTSLLVAYERWDKKWFAGRAIAESVKSLAWKYVTGADPFPSSLGDSLASERLTSQFNELVREHRALAADLASANSSGEQVTTWMSGLRGSPVGVRRDAYLSQRVEEQRAWYANKASENLRNQRWWFIGFLVAQVLACLTVIAEALEPTMTIRLAGLFAALSAALLAWMQIKRYHELAQAYGLAAQELAMIRSRGAHAMTEDELARFVADAETAISREHTGWIARREVA